MSSQPERVDQTPEQYRACLECLTFIQVDPRLRRRFEAWLRRGREAR